MEDNNFYNLAMTRWKHGENGELLAMEMAQAIKEIIIQGKGEMLDVEVTAEFHRLLKTKDK